MGEANTFKLNVFGPELRHTCVDGEDAAQNWQTFLGVWFILFYYFFTYLMLLITPTV